MLISSAGLFFFMNLSDAASANINFFLRIGDPAPLIETHPPVAIEDGGTSGGNRLAYLVEPQQPAAPADTEISPSVSPAEVTINLYVDGTIPDNASVSHDHPQTKVPQITSLRPTFKGKIGVGGALLFVELHSTTITASFNAESDGSWEWTPPRDLEVGSHILYVTVFDPSGKVKLGSSSLQFDVVAPGGNASTGTVATDTPRTDVIIPPSLVAQRKVLFDIRVNVLHKNDQGIQPGDDVLAQVSLLNIGSPGYIVDALVHYMIINDESNKVVFEESETIGVSTQASYLKTFSTKATMPQGRYRLETSVTYGDTEAFATDKFSLAGSPVIATSKETRINVSTMVQVLFIVLALSLLIMYMEYHTMEVLQGIVRQVNEQDLKKYGLV